MPVLCFQYVLLFALSCMLTKTVSGGNVIYVCTIFCESKYASLIANNQDENNVDLLREIVMCVQSCGDQLNEELINTGKENLTEPIVHRDPSEIEWPKAEQSHPI